VGHSVGHWNIWSLFLFFTCRKIYHQARPLSNQPFAVPHIDFLFFMEVRGMPSRERFKTKYPGVFYVLSDQGEKFFRIRYRKDTKLIEENAGHQIKNDMTAAKAATIRAERIKGHKPSNQEKREAVRAKESRWTIDKLWEEYKRQKTIFKGKGPDENRYLKYIKPSFENKEPKDIIPMDVDRVRLSMFKKKLSPQTVKLTLALLRRICNFGYMKRLSSPLSFSIEIPKVNNIKTEDLTTEQLTALLKAIEADKHPQAGNLMLLALYTGMRRGEMFRLKWKHIDFKKGFINLVDPKGGKDQPIPLNNSAKKLLKSIKEANEYVFPGRSGKQRTDIHKHVNAIRDAAGLPKSFRALHGLRHVFASGLASSGQVDLFTIQQLLTHKDPKTTQRYAHLRDETLKRASNVAGALIKKALNRKDSKSVVNHSGLK
jgi:integrase